MRRPRTCSSRSLMLLWALGACVDRFEPQGAQSNTTAESDTDDCPPGQESCPCLADLCHPDDSASTGGDEYSTSVSEEDESESGDDGESTAAGSTGEEINDWALRFDGDTVARKDNNGGAYGWTANSWTVEAWIEIEDISARGIIFDSQNLALTTGWVLYLHTEWNALTFSFFDAMHANQVVIGPALEDIGVGWHHVAATNSGEGNVYIHVDGVAVMSQEVSASVSTDAVVLWKIGGAVGGNTDFNLRDVVIDDLRISESPLYSGGFDPPTVFEATANTALLLNFDEGDGVVTQDTEVSYIGFAIENPEWVAGQ